MLAVIVTITRSLCVVLTVIVTIAGRCVCSANSYCYNNRDVYMQCKQFFVTIMGKLMCSVNSYCDNNDNNGEVYM